MTVTAFGSLLPFVVRCTPHLQISWYAGHTITPPDCSYAPLTGRDTASWHGASSSDADVDHNMSGCLLDTLRSLCDDPR